MANGEFEEAAFIRHLEFEFRPSPCTQSRLKRNRLMSLSRRRFLSTSAAATSALALGAYVNVSPARESKSPNGKLNIAGIGVTGRGGEDIAGVASENVVVLCDVDENKLNEGMKRFKAERKYADFR